MSELVGKVNWMITWTYMHIKGEGHLLTLVQGHSDSTFSNFFFLETAWPIEAKFYVEPPLDGGTKVWTNGLGHMTKMAAMPVYGKNSKSHLLWNQKVDDLESWCAALGTWVLPDLFKWWLWDDLDLFHCKVKSGPYFCMEKKVKQWIFSETVLVDDIKVGRCNQLNEYMNLYEYQRSSHSLRDSLRLNTFKLLSLNNRWF